MKGLSVRFEFLALLVAVSACAPSAGPEAGPGPTPSPSNQAIAAEVEVRNQAALPERRWIDRAVADLRDLGFWTRLTDDLDVVEIGSREGRENVPSDGHLADSLLTGEVTDGRTTAVCDVMFYATAVVDDLRRWHRFYEKDRIDARPPSEREYWAVLLGHELTHCLARNSGEKAAGRWEWRIRRAFKKA